jgi:hypothetical protein
LFGVGRVLADPIPRGRGHHLHLVEAARQLDVPVTRTATLEADVVGQQQAALQVRQRGGGSVAQQLGPGQLIIEEQAQALDLGGR